MKTFIGQGMPQPNGTTVFIVRPNKASLGFGPERRAHVEQALRSHMRFVRFLQALEVARSGDITITVLPCSPAQQIGVLRTLMAGLGQESLHDPAQGVDNRATSL